MHTDAAPIFILDRHGRYLAVNSAFERFFGKPAAAVVGKTTSEAGCVELTRGQLSPMIGGQAPVGERISKIHLIDRHEQARNMLLSLSALMDGSGAVYGIAGVIQDDAGPETAQPPTRTAQGAETSANPLPDFSAHGGRILLVDDNCTNQEVALGILKKLRIDADVVSNGAEALNALQITAYDLVLMDVQMPVMDGLEATRHIRNPHSAVQNHAVPIVAMTANVMQGDREKCMAAGMNDYVSKPVSVPALVKTLARWLKTGKRPNDTPKGDTPQKDNSASATKPVIFDRDRLLARLMGDESLVQVITEGFVADIPRQIDHLGACLHARNVMNAARQAHTIKGAAANINCEALQTVALEIEKAVRDGDFGHAEEMLPRLAVEFAKVKHAIAGDK